MVQREVGLVGISVVLRREVIVNRGFGTGARRCRRVHDVADVVVDVLGVLGTGGAWRHLLRISAAASIALAARTGWPWLATTTTAAGPRAARIATRSAAHTRCSRLTAAPRPAVSHAGAFTRERSRVAIVVTQGLSLAIRIDDARLLIAWLLIAWLSIAWLSILRLFIARLLIAGRLRLLIAAITAAAAA